MSSGLRPVPFLLGLFRLPCRLAARGLQGGSGDPAVGQHVLHLWPRLPEQEGGGPGEGGRPARSQSCRKGAGAAGNFLGTLGSLREVGRVQGKSCVSGEIPGPHLREGNTRVGVPQVHSIQPAAPRRRWRDAESGPAARPALAQALPPLPRGPAGQRAGNFRHLSRSSPPRAGHFHPRSGAEYQFSFLRVVTHEPLWATAVREGSLCPKT